MRLRKDDESRIRELRSQITTDLTTLRQTRDRRAPRPRAREEGRPAEPARLGRVPIWAVGAAAGLLAGVWSALRRPKSAR